MSTVQERKNKLIILSVIFWALSTVAFGLRVVSLRIRQRAFKIHDYFVTLSLARLQICLSAYVIDVIVGSTAGAYGADVTTVPIPQLITSLKVFFASEWFFVTGAAAFRLAIILLYIELFRGVWFYWASALTGALVILYWVASILTITLLCRPINSNWNLNVKGTCGDVPKTEYASAGFNLIIDFLVVALPMPIVWTLQMPKERKASVTAAFLLGLVTFSINIGRLMQTKLCEQGNTTYCALDASILIAAELSSGIIVSCAPMMGAVFLRHGVASYDRNVANNARGPVRTIGSTGRTWPRRQAQPDTLLCSQDEDVELDNKQLSYRTHIVSPERFHHANSSNQGIMVRNEMTVFEGNTPEMRV
ncbi:hypothetical protein N7466_003540 [Penicillium verhagenii]|uniref:uncharacterized protein n=1 Tax=Penicillium verhagenii TaxID=1562060 RepID=UPI002545A40C|nr:uncharacterized protein N7466_003540 [Penicillium verhagenii]KAJ5937090.1 hypothetical protein N7466_003540 [Penicillium verhagenii]